ncbi:MAG: hypothetical protein Q4G08_11070 [Capnocytophaga sp.]|nr:hypothetical protein [Capnocytophaga sp.]
MKKSAEQWLDEARQTQQRWIVFLEKLEEKAAELTDAAVPELQTVFQSEGADSAHYFQMRMGVQGQLENIRRKATDTYEQKMLPIFRQAETAVGIFHPMYTTIQSVLHECQDRYFQEFQGKLQIWKDAIDNVEKERNLEAEYQQIVDEYEAIKDAFRCTQCGGGLHIGKIFFITTHITCPFCQTQNTFEPSTQARKLEFLSRELAEQRSAPLLVAYQAMNGQAHEAWNRYRNLKSDWQFESRIPQKELLKKQLDEAGIAFRESENQANILYEKYLRTMFDHWNELVPELTRNHEGFYQNLLDQHRKTIKK